jgi:hypothetical protein
MNKYLFILLSSLLSGVLSGSLLAIIDFLRSCGTADHPHQILPSWMLFLGLGFVTSGILTLLWSIYIVFVKHEANPPLFKTALTTAVIGAMLVGFWLIYWKTKS